MRGGRPAAPVWGYPDGGRSAPGGGSSFVVKASTRSGTSCGSSCFPKPQTDRPAQGVHQQCLWGWPEKTLPGGPCDPTGDFRGKPPLWGMSA